MTPGAVGVGTPAQFAHQVHRALQGEKLVVSVIANVLGTAADLALPVLGNQDPFLE
jgi:hypothetical protein